MKRFILNIFALIIGINSISAQQSHIKELEGNADYMQLLASQDALRRAEDSTQTLISTNRKAFETATDQKDIRAKEIVKLEGELYEIRNKIGKTTAQISSIEQEYIINNINSVPTASNAGSAKESRTLFASPIFTSNLSSADIKTLSAEPKTVEPKILELKAKIDNLYSALDTLKQEYDASQDQEQVDSILKVAGNLKEQIEDADSQVEKIWIKLYNKKLDAYMILIDKIGRIDRLKLEQLDTESRQVRRAEGLAGEQLAPMLATYPLQRQLTLDYEITIAENQNLKLAKDSLEAERKRGMLQGPTYPDVHFQPRNLIYYGPITKSETPLYATVADIPTLKIPKRGLYYTIQLSAMTTPPKDVAILKGMTPLMQEKLTDGRTRYASGGFKTYAEAQAALSQMVKAGFRAPIIAAWLDGATITPTKAKAHEAAAAALAPPFDPNAALTVDITPIEGRLPASLREVITSDAPGKTIIRRSLGGKVIYSVGVFNSRTEAQSLVEALQAKENVTVKISEQ